MPLVVENHGDGKYNNYYLKKEMELEFLPQPGNIIVIDPLPVGYYGQHRIDFMSHNLKNNSHSAYLRHMPFDGEDDFFHKFLEKAFLAGWKLAEVENYYD